MKIKVVDYYYEHDCGCCTSWGTVLYVDGIEHDTEFLDTSDALKYVIERLGHSVEIERDFDDDEE